MILDIVPNHMGTGDENRWWTDPDLRAQFFDLDPATGRWRRFFDVDELAALRQEDPEVFRVTHETPLRLVAEGVVDGLRVDHPDGLADPAGYLSALAAGAGGCRPTSGSRRSSTSASRSGPGRCRARSATRSSTTSPPCSSTPPARPR